MERVNGQAYSMPRNALQVSAKAHTDAIEASFAARGLSKAVQKEAAAQCAREAQTRAEEPLAYRLSATNQGYYRRGKDTMDTAGLLSYIKDTRAMRVVDADFLSVQPSDDAVMLGEEEKSLRVSVKGIRTPTPKERLSGAIAVIKALPAQIVKGVFDTRSGWFSFGRAETDGETRRFPLSALAAIVAVAVSMMLIVASSVMITQSESELDALSVEFSEVLGEVDELRSDINAETDLLQIRDYAVDELGMVREDFVQMDYITLSDGPSIEAVEEEKEINVGLSALLSAIGLK